MEDTNNQTPQDVLDTNLEETTTETTENIYIEPAKPDVDYRTKFTESSKEALRIREELKKANMEIEELRQKGANYSDDSSDIPGFEHMSEEERQNIISFSDSVTRKALDKVYKDPAIARARQSYNESTWLQAFDEVATKFPDIKAEKDFFKSNFFNSEKDTPSNIAELLEKEAKLHLYDKAEEMGAKKVAEKNERIEIDRANSGDKTPKTTRTDEDWANLQYTNPVKFSEEYKKHQEGLKKS